MLMRRNVAAGIGSNEQGEYCRAALQRSDRKEPRYKSPTLLYFYFTVFRKKHPLTFSFKSISDVQSIYLKNGRF